MLRNHPDRSHLLRSVVENGLSQRAAKKAFISIFRMKERAPGTQALLVMA